MLTNNQDYLTVPSWRLLPMSLAIREPHTEIRSTPDSRLGANMRIPQRIKLGRYPEASVSSVRQAIGGEQRGSQCFGWRYCSRYC